MNFIVVVDKNYGIGKDNGLLTYLPEDLKFFKEKTLGKTVIMGRKTLESLPSSKPLPNRKTIVLTTNKDLAYKDVQIAHSLEELFKIIKDDPSDDIFVAGGAKIYEQLIPYCEYGYITKIHQSFNADTFIENIDQSENWEFIWQSERKNYKDKEFTFTKYKNHNALNIK